MGEKPDREFEAVAARTREAMAGMSEALVEEMTGRPLTAVLTGLAAGALCQAVEFHFSTCVGASIPFATGKEELLAQVDTYWRQALERHLAAPPAPQGAPNGTDTRH